MRRHPERALHEREAVAAILDEALYCHVAFVQDGQPVVIPTIHARAGDTLYLHESPASRMLRVAEQGIELCVCATLADGIVLARSVYNHSLNYRSVMVFGRARRVADPDEQAAALAATSGTEVAGTLVLALPTAEASAKMRSGDPVEPPSSNAPRPTAGCAPTSRSPTSR